VTAEERIARLRADIGIAQKARASAAQAHAVAQARVQAVREALQQEFGVSTPEEAAALLVKLENDRDREAAMAEAWLAKAGEQQ
jgi:hypothetical protein